MSEPRVRFRTKWLDEDRRVPPVRARDRRPAAEAPSETATTTTQTADHRRPGWVGAAIGGVVVLGLAGVVTGPLAGNSNVTGALLTGPVLLWLTVVIARRIARHDGLPQIAPILTGGWCIKMMGAVLRYRISAKVYGTGDFFDYDKWGRRVANAWMHGHTLSIPGRLAGTTFIRYVTGAVYLVSPHTLLSGFLVFSWFSFIGLIFFWRAYRIGISQNNDVKYLTWLVVLPSLAYWPSAIGKDAFMVFAMGLAAYGAACLFVGRIRPGLLATAGGLALMCMVRPHIALVAMGGLFFATLFRRTSGGAGRWLITLVFVIGAGLLVMQTASSFFGFKAFDRASIQQQITDTSKSTGEGGSEFSPIIVNSPIKFFPAAVTVLYRPFPIEAHSVQELLTAGECMLLAVLSMYMARRAWQAIRRGRDYPYILFCVGALLVFIVAFSGFSNFGLLARQRAVIQPLLLVFLVLPSDINAFLPRRRRATANA